MGLISEDGGRLWDRGGTDGCFLSVEVGDVPEVNKAPASTRWIRFAIGPDPSQCPS